MTRELPWNRGTLHGTRAITTCVRFAAILLLVLWVLAPAARAAPPLTVKARTELRMKPIRKDYDGRYVVSGQLVDRYSGEGLAGESVTIDIGGERYHRRTASDGSFDITVDAPPGPQDLAVRFAPTQNLDAAELVLDDVDVTKNPVELRLSTTAETGAVRIRVEAEAPQGSIGLPVDLLVGPAQARVEDLKKLATVTAGGAPFVLQRKAAGGPGTRRVRAVFAGDAVYSPAVADTTVELATATTTTLGIRDTSVAFEDDVVAAGKVVDEDGAGVPRAAIALVADGRRIAETVTRADGSFRVRFEASALGQGESTLQASVEPTEGWLRPSRSEMIHLTVAAPSPVPIAYTIAAFAITALVAGGFFAARTRPWERLRRGAREDGERPPGEAPAEPVAGLVPARPSLVSTLRRPSDQGFTGVVRDAIRHRPLDDARVALARGAEVVAVEVAPDGTFAVENLASGEWKVEVARHAHVTERFTIVVPHRGELRGARIDLMPVRERIFSLYKRAAMPLLPDPARWGVWSPRQVFDHVRAHKPAAALATLTDFVETSYFSGELPDEDRLPEAEARVEAALRENAV